VRAAGMPWAEFVGEPARYVAQERAAVSWLILNRPGNTRPRLPADRGRSIAVDAD